MDTRITVVEVGELSRKLRSLGLSKSYASELANGRRLPSLLLARRIETELGIPMNSWGEPSGSPPGNSVGAEDAAAEREPAAPDKDAA